MSDLSDFRNGYNQNLDTVLSLKLRLAMVVVSVVILFLNGVSIVAIYRTRHTPKTARFLSTALLIFDFVATAMYTVRRLVENTKDNFIFQIIAMGFNYLGYLDIAIMSVERLVVFQWPNFYIRRVTFTSLRVVCFVIWTLYGIIYAFECGLCYANVDDNDPDTIYCFTRVIHDQLRIIYGSTTTVSCFCLIKICFIIGSQAQKTKGSRHSWNSNKSSIVVLVCVINYLVSTICVTVMTYTIEEAYIRRLTNDLFMIANGFVDTCVYALWFKECRLELLKILGRVFPKINRKIHVMRIEIFDISTYQKRTLSSSE